MKKSKLVYTTNEALAIIAMIDEGGQQFTTNPDKQHFLPAILHNPSIAPAIGVEKAIKFLTVLKQIVRDVQLHAVTTDSMENKHLRITIEIDPTKDFTKPVTDLSSITITE